jgi:hypothetical protein
VITLIDPMFFNERRRLAQLATTRRIAVIVMNATKDACCYRASNWRATVQHPRGETVEAPRQRRHVKLKSRNTQKAWEQKRHVQLESRNTKKAWETGKRARSDPELPAASAFQANHRSLAQHGARQALSLRSYSLAGRAHRANRRPKGGSGSAGRLLDDRK